LTNYFSHATMLVSSLRERAFLLLKNCL